MRSYFVTGTDTNVGKTYFLAGFCAAIRSLGVDVGVMKPFAAGAAQDSGFKSEDLQIIAKAAQVNDPEYLLNPQFFSIPASPYTAVKNHSVTLKVDVDLVLNSFKKLSSLHEMMLVEGMGGIMTPIRKNYFVVDLIKDMNLDTIIVTRTRIGTLNHTIMTCKMAKKYGIKVQGIVMNDFKMGDDTYPIDELKDDIEDITGIAVIGSLPYIEDFSIEKLANIIQNEFNLKSLL